MIIPLLPKRGNAHRQKWKVIPVMDRPKLSLQRPKSIA